MADPVPADTLRQLSEVRSDRGRVLSVFLDLDPSEFAVAPARSTAVTSLIDRARRSVEALDGLDHDEHQALRTDVDRAQERLEEAIGTNDARALAVFVSSLAGVDQLLPLAHPVASNVTIDRTPVLGPLVRSGAAGSGWLVLLVNRRAARLLAGSAEKLVQVDQIVDHGHGQHQAGGWSQARYERSVDEDARAHLRHTVELVQQTVRRTGARRLLIGCPAEARGEVESALGSDLGIEVAGYIHIDVEESRPEDVLAAARELMHETAAREEEDILERLTNPAAPSITGLPDVLAALNERRVEVLALNDQYAAPGGCCPECGLLYPAEQPVCPVDGTPLERHQDILELAVQAAIRQSAEVLGLEPRDDGSAKLAGGVGAILRY